jgi:D-arabinose 1-dehydrogenase-like Zn-dependent alcohol dehydrogenase
MAEVMRAVAVVPTTREVEIAQVPVPRVSAPTDVKLRILEVGVCGTDKEICAFEYGAPPEGESRLVIGHESLGESWRSAGACRPCGQATSSSRWSGAPVLTSTASPVALDDKTSV